MYVAEPPRIDGVLDEPMWSAIEPVSAFKQRQPNEGAEPSERTEVRIAFNDRFLFFGITFFDSEPQKIRRTILQREGRFDQDDRFVLGLDTYFDHKNAYIFDMNPFGAQGDALVTDEGQPDWNWEGVYRTEARVADAGWVAEVAIPFTTLRYPESAEFDMGVAFYRLIQRKKEEDMWPPIGLKYRQQIFQVSQYARLTGFHDLRRHHNVEIRPYGLAGAQQTGASHPAEVVKNAGLDLKYGVTSNFTLDTTYRTDFAQVEADNAQINLTRFSLFFPEKRKFFLERSGLFAFGNPNEAMTFFSRQIGITQDILGGARFAGQHGPFAVGLLDIHTRGGNQPDANFAVARVRADVRRRATIGGIFTNVEQGAGFNRAAGGDIALRFWGSSQFTGWLTNVWTPDRATSSAAGSANVVVQNDTYNLGLNYLNVGRQFAPAVGFVQRQDMIRYRAAAGYSPRIGHGERRIRQLFFDVQESYIEGQDHHKQSSAASGTATVRFESGAEIGGGVTREFDRPDTLFKLGEVQIKPGDYAFVTATASAKTNTGRRAFGGITLASGSFYGGTRTRYSANGTFKFSKYLSTGTTVERNDFSLPVDNGQFATTLVRANVFTAVNRFLFANSLIQYSSVTGNLQANIRVDWIHTPGSDLFVVFNLTRGVYRLPTSGPDADGQAIVVKLTHLLAF